MKLIFTFSFYIATIFVESLQVDESQFGQKTCTKNCMNSTIKKLARLYKGIVPNFLKIGSVCALDFSPPTILSDFFCLLNKTFSIFYKNNNAF
jgi:hypothetical protein